MPKSPTAIARTDVAALNGGLGGTETQTDVLVPSAATLSRTSGLGLGLRVLEDGLLLESTLRLDGKLGSHVDGGDAVTALVQRESSGSCSNRGRCEGNCRKQSREEEYRSGTYLGRS